jgi:GTP-binding protein
MRSLSQAEFLAAAARAAEFPPEGPPEIAFAGRSNVGKSSAINALLGRRRLAHTSKTPGRTQTINFYRLRGDARLVDLPGYGYARVPQALRARWGELVSGYLRLRPTLAAVVLVMDACHPLAALDEQLLEWLGGTRLLALLAKADKLSRGEQRAVLERTRRRLGTRAGPGEAMLYSSLTGQGVAEAREILESWLQAGSPACSRNKRPPVKGD